jgi:hypothetical protein
MSSLSRGARYVSFLGSSAVLFRAAELSARSQDIGTGWRRRIVSMIMHLTLSDFGISSV